MKAADVEFDLLTDGYGPLGQECADTPTHSFAGVMAKEKLVELIREMSDGDGDRRSADRHDEVVATWDRWQADTKVAKVASGEAAAFDHHRAFSDERDAFLLRLMLLRTADPDNMRIKAAAVLNSCAARLICFTTPRWLRSVACGRDG